VLFEEVQIDTVLNDGLEKLLSSFPSRRHPCFAGNGFRLIGLFSMSLTDSTLGIGLLKRVDGS
jgi:hypothetical protein